MLALKLIPDSRDISRLVNSTGSEIRLVGLPSGCLLARLPLEGNREIGEYTVSQWDNVLDFGQVYNLDISAGTTFTILDI